MVTYAKGEKPRDLEAAVGGLVIDRHKNWSKEEMDDDMHPLGTGLLGPSNTQSYTKKGKDPVANRTGDKCLPDIKPRK